ncbi:MAG: methylenetetrahydrofolate reductase, partial [Bacteroidetes bacterium]|nr:methylenetetrahydrofolate reductase [Bacteroidota bacterium]
GDARQFEDKFMPEENGHKYAIDLVRQISDMNEGRYLDANIVNGEKTDFCIGVAGYPEKHFEAPNFNADMLYTKEKVDAGASYIVTQMFFDNKHYFNYLEACKALDIHVPIVPGLKPLTKKYQLSSIPRKFFINFPEDLVKAIMAAKDDQAVREIGIEWTIQQSRELKAAGVPCLHYYTMGDVLTSKAIAEAVI